MTSLEGMGRSELQALAKLHGIKANQKNADLIPQLLEKLSATEAEEGDARPKDEAAAAAVSASGKRKGGKKSKASQKAEEEKEEAEEEDGLPTEEDKEESSTMSREDMVKLGRAKIQAMAKAKGLKASGKKDDMIDTILALAEEEEVPAPKSAKKEAKRMSAAEPVIIPKAAKRASTSSSAAPEVEAEDQAVAPTPKSASKSASKRRSSAVSPSVPATTKATSPAPTKSRASSTAPSATPRRSSVMLREARYKRRSSAASRKSFAPPCHPAAADVIAMSPAAALARATPTKEAKAAGKKRKRAEEEEEEEEVAEGPAGRKAKKTCVGKSSQSSSSSSGAPPSPKRASLAPPTPSRKSLPAAPTPGRLMPWETAASSGAPVDRKSLIMAKRADGIAASKQAAKANISASRKPAPLGRTAQIGASKPYASFNAPHAKKASPARPDAKRASPKADTAKAPGAYKKVGKLPAFQFDARSIFVAKKTQEGALDAKPFTFTGSSTKPADTKKPIGYKPYSGKFQYKENARPGNSPKAGLKVHATFKPALPAAARGATPGKSAAKGPRRKSSSDELVLPACPTITL